jgi:transcription antitermination protein NusB
MISRRLLRIKVLHILYAFNQKDDETLTNSEKELFFSINKAYDLYHYFFLLITEIFRHAELKIDLGKSKNIPSFDDLNPNTRFIENKVYAQLLENAELNSYLHNQKLSWVNDEDLIRSLFIAFRESPTYRKYMALPSVTYKDDLELVQAMISELFADSDELQVVLEEKSIYWNDDAGFMLGMAFKTLSKFKESYPGGARLLPLYKNEEDQEFVRQLYRKVALNKKENEALIHQFANNWELDRIAFMDILIISMAITEVTVFPGIPVKVTLNEYIEIAKDYSTEKSSVFINGVLDKIFAHLKLEGKFRKAGRGLME